MTTDIHAELLKHMYRLIAANKPDDISILHISGCMILWIAKRESFAYFVMGIIKETNAVQSIQDFDIEENCSLDAKVSHGLNKHGSIKYTTDIIAIRDCIAHGRYKISRKTKGRSYILEFKWRDRSYNFNKSFSALDFVAYTREYMLFEELQGILLTIAMCLEHIKRHLKKIT